MLTLVFVGVLVAALAFMAGKSALAVGGLLVAAAFLMRAPRSPRYVLVPLALSAVLFLVSLALPALLFEKHAPVYGRQLLLFGWWGILTLDFAWFANVAYLPAFDALLAGRNRPALVASAIGIVLSLLSFGVREFWFNEGSGTPVTGIGPAYYVWLASFVVIAVGALHAGRVDATRLASGGATS